LKILLDNCVPLDFVRYLPGHEVTHCSRLGWEKLGNGKLLTAADDAGFPVMVTVDHSIQFQQNMAGRKVAVIYLRARKNKVDVLAPMGDLVLNAIDDLQPGTVLTIRHPDWQ
jgi:predicted nuclease of predicted toxin-antitoxin system